MEMWNEGSKTCRNISGTTIRDECGNINGAIIYKIDRHPIAKLQLIKQSERDDQEKEKEAIRESEFVPCKPNSCSTIDLGKNG